MELQNPAQGGFQGDRIEGKHLPPLLPTSHDRSTMPSLTPLSRRRFLASSAAIGFTSAIALRSFSVSANDGINLGFIGCGGRAGQLMGQFSEIPGANIAGLCDPDEKRLGLAGQRFPKAQQWSDLRDLIDSDSIDAVVIATCNHWHCLAAIWAMQAGKDVYVEKPLSHSQWEGRQTVAAARKYNKVCQIGTQQRSDPMQTDIKKFLHDEKGLGEIKSARVNRYGLRRSIGRRETPLPIDKKCRLRFVVRPGTRCPPLSRKTTLRLALGLEHRKRRDGQLGRSCPG